ncbi:KH homology domain-containing protein 4-like [Pocillopora damicornis]|uniref:KH homology domain-containing protein 4-like n=1 Tax=Pocillopora damicornis TaxID=46731 RepID=UPI000F559622|nr:KH homology domain-containing protein 4-like [Pocillopora damicornis]
MAAFRRPRKSKWDVPSAEGEGSNGNGNMSATDAAKERAAKLNAMLAAQGKLAKSNPPPVVGRPSPAAKVTPPPSVTVNNGATSFSQDLITAEVEINDSAARTLLCKGTTQDEINRYSGAAVSTRGKFMSENEKREAEGTGVKPLYLCVQGLTQEKVDLAVKRIREIMAGADVNVLPPSQPQKMPVTSPAATPAFNQPSPMFDRQPLPPGMHYVQDKVFVGLDNSLPEFNVKEKLQGPGGSYFQHITMQTGAKVQLRGRGSGYIEPTSGKEAFEALYIYISHGRVDGLTAAKTLVENLIQTVHTEYKAYEQTRRSHYGYSPYMNAGNQSNIGQTPSGYQPGPYGYPRPPQPPANGYPQSVQPPPASGYLYSNPYHVPPMQPPPSTMHHGAPPPGPPRYGPPPTPVSGYGNRGPPNNLPPRGPAPYPGFPPVPPPLGAPPVGSLPYGPQPEAPFQHPTQDPVQLPSRENEYQPGEPTSSSEGDREKYQREAVQPPDPPKRKFKEKIPIKGSSAQDQSSTSGPRHQDSSILNLGEAAPVDGKKQSSELMPPPPVMPVIKKKPKENEFAVPLPLKDVLPASATSSTRSRPAGKREAPSLPLPQADVKKSKTEEDVSAQASGIASLVAYGDDDSSDEEGGSLSPDDNPNDGTQSKDVRRNRQGTTRLPFWAVRK